MSDPKSVQDGRALVVENNQKLFQSLTTRLIETYGAPKAVLPTSEQIDDELNGVIWDMQRDTIIDLLDEALGCGFYDDRSDDDLRDILSKQVVAGMISRDEIMALADTEEGPAPGM